jgi:hypothetical protein
VIAMSRRRWSDNDTYFGPFTYASDKYKSFAMVLGSGDDEEYPGCRLRMSALGHTLILVLPAIIKPFKRKVYPTSWDEATVARLGRNWYFDNHEREYGFSYSKDMGGVGGGGFLQVFYGYEIDMEGFRQRWSCFTPWNNWQHVRRSLYGLNGEHYWTEPKRNWKLLSMNERGLAHDLDYKLQESCPTRTFRFSDFDGEVIDCKTRIEEREWRMGTGWFQLLSRFKKPIIHRSLDLYFSKETGRRKGSWKGGTTGHSIEMLPGELHEAAFKRYCDGDDRRDGKRDMKFIGEVA